MSGGGILGDIAAGVSVYHVIKGGFRQLNRIAQRFSSKGGSSPRGVVNPKIYAQLERQLARDGAKSIHRSLRSAEKTLQKHLDKLPKLKYKTQVKGTIQNVRNQIETLKQFIKDNGL